jgi:hypothetical protein
MKKFNFRKLGILLAMMLVGGMFLVGSASAASGDWTYDTGSGWKVGAYGEYSNYQEGFIWAGSVQSTAGSNDLDLQVLLCNIDIQDQLYSNSGYGTRLISGTMGYYAEDGTRLRDYHPHTETFGMVGSGYHNVPDYPDT